MQKLDLLEAAHRHNTALLRTVPLARETSGYCSPYSS
uniref:Uncharacterized protein n=1 Tax=Rhizophora mucronata TaxID=61149 RepID=A0A2P2QEG1_RHIMU